MSTRPSRGPSVSRPHDPSLGSCYMVASLSEVSPPGAQPQPPAVPALGPRGPAPLSPISAGLVSCTPVSRPRHTSASSGARGPRGDPQAPARAVGASGCVARASQVGGGTGAHRQEGVNNVGFDGAQGLVLDNHEDLLLLLQVDEVPKPRLLGEPGQGGGGGGRGRVCSLSAEILGTGPRSPPGRGRLTALLPPPHPPLLLWLPTPPTPLPSRARLGLGSAQQNPPQRKVEPSLTPASAAEFWGNRLYTIPEGGAPALGLHGERAQRGRPG